MADELSPYEQVMQQARQMYNQPQLPSTVDPNASTVHNMLNGIFTGLNAIRPGAAAMPRLAPRMTRQDSIPTITGGGSRFDPSMAPFSSGDIASGSPGVFSTADVARVFNTPNLTPANTNSPIPTRASFGNRPPIPTAEPSVHPNPTVNTIANWMHDANIPVERIERRGGSHYIVSIDNAGRPVHVRVPEDGHMGRAARSGGELGNRFDTGSILNEGVRRDPLDPRITGNVSGGQYSDLNNLFPALMTRFSRAPNGGNWLTSPDVAPVFRQAAEQQPPRVRQDPNQLNLPFDTKGRPPRQLPPDRTTVVGTSYPNDYSSRNFIAPNTAYQHSITYRQVAPYHQHVNSLHGAGLTNFQIAQQLGGGITPGQVSSYLQNVLRKVPNGK